MDLCFSRLLVVYFFASNFRSSHRGRSQVTYNATQIRNEKNKRLVAEKNKDPFNMCSPKSLKTYM